MADNSQAPATKQDVAFIMDALAKVYQEIQASEDRQHQKFMVLFEDLRHDMIGTHKDKIQQHEERIQRLEKHTKLVAA